MSVSLLQGALGFALLWWLLCEGQLQTAWLGLIGVAAALAAQRALAPPAPQPRLVLRALPGFFGYFLLQSIRGGLQVASMALRRRLDLRPVETEVALDLPPGLPPGLPRVVLAAAVSLMPGSVSVHLGEDRLKIHVLDERLPIADEVQHMALRVAVLFGARR